VWVSVIVRFATGAYPLGTLAVIVSVPEGSDTLVRTDESVIGRGSLSVTSMSTVRLRLVVLYFGSLLVAPAVMVASSSA